MDLHQFLFLFFIRNLAHILMVFAVVSQIMPICEDGLDVLGIALHPASGHKKGHFHIILFKDFENLLRILISPCRIKGECNLLSIRLIRFHTVNRQLPVSDRVTCMHAVSPEHHCSTQKCGGDKQKCRIPQKQHADSFLIIRTFLPILSFPLFLPMHMQTIRQIFSRQFPFFYVFAHKKSRYIFYTKYAGISCPYARSMYDKDYFCCVCDPQFGYRLSCFPGSFFIILQ